MRLVAGVALASAVVTTTPGSWTRLPAAPIAPTDAVTSVWTGRQMIVVGRETIRAEDGAVLSSKDVAAAYDPAAGRWLRLRPPARRQEPIGRYASAWTGTAMVVWSPSGTESFDPRTNRWRRLPTSPLGRVGGVVVWTGRELIGWGGGCCGDAFADGAAYDPAANRWRRLPRAPLAGAQSPSGAWTGRELILFGVREADGPPLRSAAAYNPTTNRWRRIAPLPVPLYGATTVWDGREVLALGLSALAYNPTTNRWRRLPRMESQARTGEAALWTGRRVLVWGGQGPNGEIPAHGYAYTPATNRWSSLPPAPVVGRIHPAAAWTGRALVVWGGSDPYRPLADGAAFTPQ